VDGTRGLALRIGAGLLAIYLLWGSTFLGIRLVVETIPPLLGASLRWCLAGGLMYAALRPAGGSSWRQWGQSAALSVLLVVASNGGVTWAETRVPSGLASLGIATVSPWMVVLEALRPGGTRPSWLGVLGVLVGIAGVASLVDPGAAVDGLGLIVLLVAAFSFSLGSTLSRTWPERGEPLVAVARQMIAGGLILLVLAWAFGEPLSLRGASPLSLGAVVWLALMGSIAGYSLFSWLVRVARPEVVGTYACVNPVVALSLGAWLADEQLTPRMVGAAGLVIVSVALVTLSRALQSRAKLDWKVDRESPVVYPAPSGGADAHHDSARGLVERTRAPATQAR
jgi:drug/metabolite transporter (DMT)-like permease